MNGVTPAPPAMNQPGPLYWIVPQGLRMISSSPASSLPSWLVTPSWSE